MNNLELLCNIPFQFVPVSDVTECNQGKPVTKYKRIEKRKQKQAQARINGVATGSVEV